MSQDDAAQLQDQLELCQRELAQVREELEVLAERRSTERRKRVRAEQRLFALSRAVDAKLRGAPEPRSARRLLQRQSTPLKTRAEEIQLLQASPLFHGPFYVRRNPDVVTDGRLPELHYLEVGAAAGYDPSPDFSTSDYLSSHPELLESGENPLIHHLRNKPSGAGGKSA